MQVFLNMYKQVIANRTFSILSASMGGECPRPTFCGGCIPGAGCTRQRRVYVLTSSRMPSRMFSHEQPLAYDQDSAFPPHERQARGRGLRALAVLPSKITHPSCCPPQSPPQQSSLRREPYVATRLCRAALSTPGQRG
eukprot:362344-Chlamydomonas_euryale.AAC.4